MIISEIYIYFETLFGKSDTMGERMGRIGRIRTDFSCHSVGNRFLRNDKEFPTE
jgi:hypothetical protein